MGPCRSFKDFPLKRPQSPKVALLLHRLTGFHSEVMRGIRDYAHYNATWRINLATPTFGTLELARSWGANGIITLSGSAQFETALRALNLPAVDIGNAYPHQGLPRVTVDDHAVGQLAAQHLLDTGLSRFAFVGRINDHFSEQRWMGFSETIVGAGSPCHRKLFHHPDLIVDRWSPNQSQSPLSEWLNRLPHPIGVFCDTDEVGAFVTSVCGDANLSVPDQIAVLGVDNNAFSGVLSYPPLSSIEVPARQIGFRAASLLKSIMEGGETPTAPVLLPPVRVVSRRSTDVLATANPVLREALTFIRENASSGIGVDELVAHSSVGRRTLEKLFKVHLQRTPLEEIQRVKVSLAQRMLTTTDFGLETVADRSGFGSVSWLIASFTKYTGVTPGVYRRQFGLL